MTRPGIISQKHSGELDLPCEIEDRSRPENPCGEAFPDCLLVGLGLRRGFESMCRIMRSTLADFFEEAGRRGHAAGWDA